MCSFPRRPCRKGCVRTVKRCGDISLPAWLAWQGAFCNGSAMLLWARQLCFWNRMRVVFCVACFATIAGAEEAPAHVLLHCRVPEVHAAVGAYLVCVPSCGVGVCASLPDIWVFLPNEQDCMNPCVGGERLVDSRLLVLLGRVSPQGGAASSQGGGAPHALCGEHRCSLARPLPCTLWPPDPAVRQRRSRKQHSRKKAERVGQCMLAAACCCERDAVVPSVDAERKRRGACHPPPRVCQGGGGLF